jgi:REP element-mobilizing transposase RayT
MPRCARKYLKTTFFHVMVQGINKCYIFDNKYDILYYIKNINKFADETEVKVVAYCIMNNHAHFLINTEKTELLSKFMQKLNTKFAIYYNKKYERTGYVFRNRFRSEGIYSEHQFYRCIQYIYNNPVKAGICKRPEDYPYSNFTKKYNKYDVKLQDEDYNFIDVESDSYDEIIDKYIKDNMINKDRLLKNKDELKKLVYYLKNDKKISYRKLEKSINISRETLRKI